jgi:hypothetical protein
MKTKNKILITIIFILLLSFFIFLYKKNNSIEQNTNNLDKNIIENYSSAEKVNNDIFLKIDSITKKTVLEINNKKYETETIDNISVYELMKKMENENKIFFKEKNYIGMGKFIEEINGIKSDGEKYWIYYVNNEKANVGISNYKIKSGDVVSWRLEENIY